MATRTSPRAADRAPTGPASPPDALGCDLGWALGVVFRSYVHGADDVLRRVPGGPRGYQVLTATAEGSPEGQGALARRLGVDKTVMTYLVDGLEDAGLLSRRPDPSDRRHKLLVATARGRRTVAGLQSGLGQVEEQVLGALSAGERQAFRDLLQRVALRAQSHDPVGDTCEAAALAGA